MVNASSRRLVAWILFVALVSGVAYASRFTAGRPDRNALYQWSTAIGELTVFAVILAVTLAIAGGRYDLLALNRPASWRQALLLCVLLLIVVYAAIAAIDPLLHGGREQGLTPSGWQPQHAAAYGANFVVIAAVAPFVEETALSWPRLRAPRASRPLADDPDGRPGLRPLPRPRPGAPRVGAVRLCARVVAHEDAQRDSRNAPALGVQHDRADRRGDC